ncbi:MAG: cell division protein FtsA [Candidatus Chisholmbacteria bacterium RIFCSPLOWO2_01_FULL_49_14]|uniref:Cell division protein FtsA n=1 Tax=Candidatus Chisholmbacteria bacterium RIFCSPLOWO2_01_FULL_49_14 TaxID=1797593 RepID=A0A1G1W069_9BACT|nr:MAG: cell division protein FtsA [Candidatus Chisholmbacteria bacterium RIFCSPLOWO2_01_FULL_49_14]
MQKGKMIAAIDVGTEKVTTVIASESLEHKKINVMGVSATPSKGIRKSQIVDIEEATESITESVEAAERMAGYSITQAIVAIDGAHISSQNSKGVVAVADPDGEITSEDVERVIEAARAVSLPSAREIIHVVPRNFTVDSQEGIKDPVGMSGVRLEADAHLITASSTAIRNLTKCINEIGADVTRLVFGGLAASESVLTETEKELGVVLVDIGAGTTSLVVFVEGNLTHTSVLPIGARNITNDLAIGMRISSESAEKIKRFLSKGEIAKIGDGKEKKEDEIELVKLELKEEIKTASRKTLVEGIIKPRLHEIFSMIGIELKKSGVAGQTPAGLVITGGGAETIGLSDAAKRSLSMPTRIGNPTGLSGLVDEIESPAYAVASGLVLYASRKVPEGKTGFGGGLRAVTERLPGKGIAVKIVDFVKSFLP